MSENMSQRVYRAALAYISGGIASPTRCYHRIVVRSLVSDSLLYYSNIQSEEGSEETAFTKVAQFQEIDRSYWEAFRECFHLSKRDEL